MSEDKFIVTYAGTSYPEKGVDVFVEAIKKLENENIKFCLLGKHQMDFGPIKDKLFRFGFVSEVELQEILNYTDVFVEPSDPNHPNNRYKFPSKILHYLEYQKPILSTMIAGIPEEYRNVLIDFEYSVSSLTAKIEEVFQWSTDEKNKYQETVSRFIESKSKGNQKRKLNNFIDSI